MKLWNADASWLSPFAELPARSPATHFWNPSEFIHPYVVQNLSCLTLVLAETQKKIFWVFLQLKSIGANVLQNILWFSAE